MSVWQKDLDRCNRAEPWKKKKEVEFKRRQSRRKLGNLRSSIKPVTIARQPQKTFLHFH